MAFGKGKKAKAPKSPEEEQEEKAKKGKKPKKEKKPKPPKAKKGKKGAEDVPVEEQGGTEEAKKKKIKPIFLLIPVVAVAAIAAVVIFVVLPRFRGGDADAEPTATVEPEPPELPETLMVGENEVIGMALEADESGAEAVLSKTITYTYINLNDAGKAAETYVNQLISAEDRFYLVDEDFVRRSDKPDYSAEEGSVIMARTLPLPEVESPAETAEPEDPDASEDPDNTPEPTPTPEPEPEPVRMVLTVRISWSEGQCVVTADEEEGMVTSPPPSTVTSSEAVTMRGAQDRIKAMEPSELGLPGESMDEYEVISMDGVAMVDGVACIRVHVYSEETEIQGSEFMGSYYMTIDGQHLYRVNPVTDEVETLK